MHSFVCGVALFVRCVTSSMWLLQESVEDLKQQLGAAQAAEAAGREELQAAQQELASLKSTGTVEVQAWQQKLTEKAQVGRSSSEPGHGS